MLQALLVPVQIATLVKLLKGISSVWLAVYHRFGAEKACLLDKIIWLFGLLKFIAWSEILICNNRKAIKVTLWFFFSNIAYIVGIICFAKLARKSSENPDVWCFLLAFCIGVFICFQSVAHFQFTFNYFQVVMMIPYVIENKKMPPRKQNCLMSYFWAWRIANGTLSLLLGI